MDTENRSPILRYALDAVAQVLAETTGNDTSRYLYGLDLFAQQQDATTTYLGYDALSVRLHLDADGAIAATYRYGPYGEVVGAGPAGYGYTGEQWDHYIKMTYLRARYYQPEIGRFISRDQWAGRLRQPETLHRYTYAGSAPTGFRDPSGFGSEPILSGAALATIRQESGRFGLPWQVVAGVIECARVVDVRAPGWEWIEENILEGIAYPGPFAWLWDTLYEEGLYMSWPEIRVGDTVILPEVNHSPGWAGYDPGAGIGSVHVSTAYWTSWYFWLFYQENQAMQLPSDLSPGQMTKRLTEDKFNIQYATGLIRLLADYRFAPFCLGLPLKRSHADLAEWTITDAVAVWHGYRYGVPGVSIPEKGLGFGKLSDFQNRTLGLEELITIAKGVDKETSMRSSVSIFEKYFRSGGPFHLPLIGGQQ